MDFKPSIKTLGQLLLLLAVIGIIVVASAGAMNYGFRAHRPVIGVAGALNLILGGVVVGRYVVRQIRGNNL